MLYFDCFSGASGDMILGALLDLGLPLDALRSALGSLAIEFGDVRADRVLRAGVSATKFNLQKGGHPVYDHPRHDHPHHDHPHTPDHADDPAASAPSAPSGRAPSAPLASLAPLHHDDDHHSLKEIVHAIRRSSLSTDGQARAIGLFERLAEAEAEIHRIPVEHVHLHEVGAPDSIIDIVGAVYAFEWFGIDDIAASPLNVGGGRVRCAHGTFPVPAPATARLLAGAGVPVYSSGAQSELLTPTGALLITAYAREYGPIPAMTIDRIGYGAGDREIEDMPNVLRVLQGNRAGAAADQRIVKLECELDDMNPQLFGPLMDGLHAAGALDVFYTPVHMKKNRPGTLITVIAPPDRRQALTDVLFRDSTTIGVRFEELSRTCLERRIESVDTPYGSVRIKIARRGSDVLNAAPEFDDCLRLATERGVPIKAVQAAAIKARLDGSH